VASAKQKKQEKRGRSGANPLDDLKRMGQFLKRMPLPENLPDELRVRQSLCCGKEGCRRRSLPPSVLFGRQFYWNIAVLIVTTLRQNQLNGDGAGKLMKMLGVGPRTIKRWMIYFREVFPPSREWLTLRGRLSGEVRNNHLPADVVNYFIRVSSSVELGLVTCLRALYGTTLV